MSQPSLQEIQKRQGTRLSDTAPWESYADEMDVKMSEQLAKQVAEYAEKHYENSKVDGQTAEALAQSKEINDAIAKEYQWLTPQEYADYGARIGKVLSHAEFITKLRENGVYCHYRQHTHHDKAVLYISKNGLQEPEIACWVQIGQMPELSLMNFDDHGVPLAERRRGWRTCLLQIILKGFIIEEKANKIFGKPRIDDAFARYNSTLHAFRNAGSKLE